MKEFLSVIANTSLFKGITEEQIAHSLSCFQAKTRIYGKGEYLLRIGENIEEAGILLFGCALIVQEDFWGNRNVIGKVFPSELFAESFACAEAPLTVSVVAEEECTVLWLNASRMLTLCPSACAHHGLLVRNLVAELAKKNLLLNEKLTHIGQRTTRRKVLVYLSSQAAKQKSQNFEIPFNRQQLADYLAVERSALSAELSKLKQEGIIDYHRNKFRLKRIILR